MLFILSILLRRNNRCADDAASGAMGSCTVVLIHLMAGSHTGLDTVALRMLKYIQFEPTYLSYFPPIKSLVF